MNLHNYLKQRAVALGISLSETQLDTLVHRVRVRTQQENPTFTSWRVLLNEIDDWIIETV